MKEITIKVPENKLKFLTELIRQLGFEISAPAEIPESHKSIVRERIAASNANPGNLKSWDEVKDSFKFD